VEAQVVGYSWIFPIIMGLAHLMINGMNFTELMTDEDRPGVATRARLFLMLAVVMQIAMVFASAMIMGQVYLTDNKDTANRWSGISLLLSQIIMFVACWTQRLPTLPTPST
jgi:membrane-anchored protein YejM (alkaline phosphatase superfamily)